VLKHEDGEGTGAIRYDFRNRQVEIKNCKTKLKVQPVALIISNKLAEYTAPYLFLKPPTLAIEGWVDLETQKKTDLKVNIEAPAGMLYVFLGKTIKIDNLSAELRQQGKSLKVKTRSTAHLFDGGLDGNIQVALEENPSYLADFQLSNQDFGEMMLAYFDNKEVKGRYSATASLRGKLHDMATITGWGSVSVKDGTLYPIPVFGGLSQILNAIIPNLGYSQASAADSIFEFKDGNIHMSKIDIHSSGFAMIGNGKYDYMKDAVDLSMRVNIRGLIGAAFYPLSKLFEYRGTGTLKETVWEAKAF
jgi:hypothetical protein